MFNVGKLRFIISICIFVLVVIIFVGFMTRSNTSDANNNESMTEVGVEESSSDISEDIVASDFQYKIESLCGFITTNTDNAFSCLNNDQMQLLIYNGENYESYNMSYSEYKIQDVESEFGYYYYIYNNQVYVQKSDYINYRGPIYYSIPDNITQFLSNYDKEVVIVTIGENEPESIVPEMSGYSCYNFYVDNAINWGIFTMYNTQEDQYSYVAYDFCNHTYIDITNQITSCFEDISLCYFNLVGPNVLDIVNGYKEAHLDLNSLDVLDITEYESLWSDMEIIFQKNLEGIYAYNSNLDKKLQIPDISDACNYTVEYRSNEVYIFYSRDDDKQWIVNYETGEVEEFKDINLIDYVVYSIDNKLFYGQYEYIDDVLIPFNYIFNIYEFK